MFFGRTSSLSPRLPETVDFRGSGRFLVECDQSRGTFVRLNDRQVVMIGIDQVEHAGAVGTDDDLSGLTTFTQHVYKDAGRRLRPDVADLWYGGAEEI